MGDARLSLALVLIAVTAVSCATDGKTVNGPTPTATATVTETVEPEPEPVGEPAAPTLSVGSTPPLRMCNTVFGSTDHAQALTTMWARDSLTLKQIDTAYADVEALTRQAEDAANPIHDQLVAVIDETSAYLEWVESPGGPETWGTRTIKSAFRALTTECTSTFDAAESKAAPKPRPSQPPAPSQPTLSQQNAVQAAQSYLDYSAFSYQGLIDQLSSEYGEGFPVPDATYAVNHVDVDWNAEAVESARSYLEQTGYSRQGLIDQLSSPYGEQFSLEAATYAVNKVGL